jgi:multimeric flavodoxin WrbA
VLLDADYDELNTYDEGNTAMILNPFLEGMKEDGCEVEVFYTKKLSINPCNGDLSCWFVNPGVCIHKDDMQMLLPRIKEADVIVWASPVYYSGLTGPLKNLMDRQLPLIGEILTGQSKPKKAVLVSTCSDWELSMFDPLLAQMKGLYAHPEAGQEFAGALLRPMAEGMKEMAKAGETRLVDGVLQAAREAGRRLAREGVIPEELSRQVSRELMPKAVYNKAAELMMEQIRAAAENSKRQKN